MPVRNGEKTVLSALNSLRHQSYEDIRINVYDNASTDKTAEIIKALSAEDKRIQIFESTINVGAVSNFIRALEGVETEYFMWAAADDFWAPNYAELLHKVLDNSSAIGSFGRVWQIDSDGNPINSHPANGRFFPFSAESSPRTRRFRYLASSDIRGKANLWYSLFRTKTVQAAIERVPLSVFSYDVGFLLHLLNSGPLLSAPGAHFFKRIHGGNVSPTDHLSQHQVAITSQPPRGYFLMGVDSKVSRARYQHLLKKDAFDIGVLVPLVLWKKVKFQINRLSHVARRLARSTPLPARWNRINSPQRWESGQ